MSIACPRCGLLSPPDHRFCGHCGAALEPATVHKEESSSPEAAPAPIKTPESTDRAKTRGPGGLGCGLIGGLLLPAVLLVSEATRAGFVSFEAVVHFVFNVGFYGCIAAAIGFGIARQGKKAGFALLALVLFLGLWFAFWWGLSLLPGS